MIMVLKYDSKPNIVPMIEPFQSSDHDKYHMYLTIHYNKNDSHSPFPHRNDHGIHGIY
jgi:hypothetical protein